jgi:hypothetical protein
VSTECVLPIAMGGGGMGSQCTLYTNMSVDTEGQTFYTLLKIKINYKNTIIDIVTSDYQLHWQNVSFFFF